MKLELYHFQSCPYCIKVRNHIERLGLNSHFEYFDILTDSKAYERLMKLNNDDQVPCLVINGVPMLESDDIIAWINKNFKRA